MQRRSLERLQATGAAGVWCLPASLRAGAPATVSAAPGATAWRDVLDSPASISALATRGLVNGLARAGSRIVAVGQRGHVLTSDDGAASWRQASVPVSSDLVAVSFATPQLGWAVGHDGIVLASGDAGLSWTRRLDGRTVGELLVAHYTRSGDDKWLAEARRLAAQGAENPWLDVCFTDTSTGYIVGAFGLALRTRDGGASWEPLMHLCDNPKALHLYAVRAVAGRVVIVGEQGLALRLDEATGRFVALDLPYKGTLFGLIGNSSVLLAHGLRGKVLRSSDGGQQWSTVATNVQSGLTAAALDERGRFVLVSQAGHVLVSGDEGASFQPAKVDRPLPAAAVLALSPGRVLLAGPRGLAAVALS